MQTRCVRHGSTRFGQSNIERLAAALTERVHRRLIELDDAPTSEAPQATAVGI
jgi:hypothetical protein